MTTSHPSERKHASFLDPKICRRARRTRDARFDGMFFIAVRTTGIYCRPICPVTNVKEENVTYYPTAIDAARAGYRPCLRCRPDAAPGSAAWRGVDATMDRATHLIHSGFLQDRGMTELAAVLGIGDRYLRKLFQSHLGVSPKLYATYHQCLFAKTLLQTTGLSITETALASGFRSVRRFNDAFRNQIGMAPRDIRRKRIVPSDKNTVSIHLAYRPPYNWESLRRFFGERLIPSLEWLDETSYGRSFQAGQARGSFTAVHREDKPGFDVSITLDDFTKLKPVVANIRRLLDLDADSARIDEVVASSLRSQSTFISGVRIPGVWDEFEAGVRAIFGQQITVRAAHRYCAQLVNELGDLRSGIRWFPTADAVAKSDLEFLKMPSAKKETLRSFASHVRENTSPDHPEQWISIKGVGPWTIRYAKLRGTGSPDVFMSGDLGVKKMQKTLQKGFEPEHVSPWGSYLTMQLWLQGCATKVD